ncbi:ATP-dependent DNA helicase RecQ [Acidipila sp. EB88]|uniref:RecQ family ATP-dependent DNA helicase n=1 Tax=Acidipila sp. EB88 TaxID=2305226 RepID=UPI000F5DE366|nr:ATP-dependent DNA helicase RecQ [Acidipila sp. EB88]RRA48411.1 ATP-dependent DNA helicase RecQ [Acidipila sp. EB88]
MPAATSPHVLPLHVLLEQRFGFRAFRANQEAVCRAAVEGADVLLVMPTGAGKSLCYQLPALARGGTALVISPLIALMDDQAAKLEALGLNVARIHSGLSRESAREACRGYLDGTLDFLFIAPERLRVPGFPEMLAKRKPGLIAIDEAHCISQWGHDFRPDYRMLGQHLQNLRPSPVIALTATATTQVQHDIVAQLGLGHGGREPAVFIHGFRRDNLAIEVVEVPKPKRPAFASELLADPAARPAIVYAPTRKDAEMLAGELGRSFRAAAYHAGLEPDHRERVQRAFLAGELEIVVATIAFGMGIDKANVRTVLHIALPSTLEGYYQEIGRAGRDGLPSRTILMHSFADRKQHDFFFERDYPPVERLDAIYKVLGEDPIHREKLPDLLKRAKMRLEQEELDKALEKLLIHGGAVLDYEGFVTLGHGNWRKPYLVQSTHRGSQLDRVIRFTESGDCRMTQLVRHFGDTEDGLAGCGICDVCAPGSSLTQTARPLDASELRLAHQVVGALAGGGYGGGSKSTGKLHSELCAKNGMTRDSFEDLLNALAAAGFLRIEETSFEKDGRTIPYRKASLTHEGGTFSDRDAETVMLRELNGSASAAAAPAGKRTRKPAAGNSRGSAREDAPLSGAAAALEERLRAWRKAEAQKLGQPAFCIFPDKTLRAIAEEQPRSEDDLLAIAGLGPAKITKFGEGILGICAAVR